MQKDKSQGGQRGGAALEYILVSTFAAVVGMAALGFVGRVVKNQLANMAAKLGMEEVPDIGSPFGDGSGD
jgi:hypothetical protein